jgi:chitodextrinase
LSWSASSDNVGVAGYGVFRNGVLVAALSDTTFQDTGLNPDITYTCRVRAVDAAGNVSAQSAAASATTSNTTDGSVPTTPTGLAAATVSAFQVDLSWLASTDNVAVTGYRIYRNGTFLTTLGNVTAFRDSGLAPSTACVYNVDAIDAAANASGVSAAATASTLAPDTATLSWDAVTDANLSGYRVYCGNAPGTYFQAIGAGDPVPAGVTTYVLTGLATGTRYYIAVTAFSVCCSPYELPNNWYVENNSRPISASSIPTWHLVDDAEDRPQESLQDPDVNGHGWFWNSAVNPMSGVWSKIEQEVKYSRQSDGYIRLWENGVLKINYAGPTDRYAGNTRSEGIGGYARSRSTNNWRYFADAYLDYTRARVVLANNPSLSLATIIEPQVTTNWSGTSIGVSVNLGRLTSGQTAYLFVIDPAGTANAAGFPVVLGNTVSAFPAPTNLRVF